MIAYIAGVFTYLHPSGLFHRLGVPEVEVLGAVAHDQARAVGSYAPPLVVLRAAINRNQRNGNQ